MTFSLKKIYNLLLKIDQISNQSNKNGQQYGEINRQFLTNQDNNKNLLRSSLSSNPVQQKNVTSNVIQQQMKKSFSQQPQQNQHQHL